MKAQDKIGIQLYGSERDSAPLVVKRARFGDKAVERDVSLKSFLTQHGSDTPEFCILQPVNQMLKHEMFQRRISGLKHQISCVNIAECLVREIAMAADDDITSRVVVTIEETQEGAIQLAWQFLIGDQCQTGDIFTTVQKPSDTADDIQRIAAPAFARMRHFIATVPTAPVEVLIASDEDPSGHHLKETLETLFRHTANVSSVSMCHLASALKGAVKPPQIRASLIVDTHLRNVEASMQTEEYRDAYTHLKQAKAKALLPAHIAGHYDRQLRKAVAAASETATGRTAINLLWLRAEIEHDHVNTQELSEVYRQIAGEFSRHGAAASTQNALLIADFLSVSGP